MKSHLVRLQQFLTAYFDAEELRTLALTLGLNYDDLGGDQRLSARARDLVLAIGRQQRWPELLAALREERPEPFAQAQLSVTPAFSDQLRAEFAALRPDQQQTTPAVIQQKAGNKAVQIGQNFGQIIVQHPPRQILLVAAFGAVLLVALFWLVLSFFLPQLDDVQSVPPPNNASPTPPGPAGRKLEALVLPALADTHLEDIAAGGGVVWFGAQEGLYVLRPGDQDARRVVAGVVTAVAAATDASAWFGLSSHDGAQLGRYSLDGNQVEWFTADVLLDTAVFITAIVAGNEGMVWLGDSAGNIYRLNANTKERYLLPAPSLPIGSVYSLALAPEDPDTVWVVGSQAVFRWQADQWVTAVAAAEIVSGVINAVAGGVGQRAWFGHTAGLTLFQARLNVDIRQECAVPDLPSTLITDLVTAKEGQELWLVSRGGLAWLDARSEATLPDNCAAWQWQTWTDDGFWQTATAPGVFRLAVDEKAGEEPLVWVIRQGAGRVRWLPDSDRQ
ncbi:MAG TPA: hypothetical protein PLD25_19465 [Chloroflexota bacterium]|nr:hypothetical protein [Chloroflexota bacterium]